MSMTLAARAHRELLSLSINHSFDNKYCFMQHLHIINNHIQVAKHLKEGWQTQERRKQFESAEAISRYHLEVI